MVCVRCNRDVSTCECSDIDERLASIAAMSHVAAKFCKKCNQHYARCHCAEPEFEIRGGGLCLVKSESKR